MFGKINDPELKDIHHTRSSLQCRISKFEDRHIAINEMLERYKRSGILSADEKKVLLEYINHARVLIEHFAVCCEDDKLGNVAKEKIEKSFLPKWKQIKKQIEVDIKNVFETEENSRVVKIHEINMRNLKYANEDFMKIWKNPNNKQVDESQLCETQMSSLDSNNITSADNSIDNSDEDSEHNYGNYSRGFSRITHRTPLRSSTPKSLTKHNKPERGIEKDIREEENSLLTSLLKKYLKIEAAKQKKIKVENIRKIEESSDSSNDERMIRYTMRNSQKNRKMRKENIYESDSNEESEVEDLSSFRRKSLKLDLPKFDGDYTKFHDFFSMFNLVVHNDKKMSELEKLYHLKFCMEGRPKSLLSFIAIEKGNYKEAYKLLKQTFDKPVERKKSLRKELQSIQTCNYDNMRETFDKIKSIACALNKYSNVDTEEMITMIRQKFPKPVIRSLLLQTQQRCEPLSLTETLNQIEFGINTEIELQEELGNNKYNKYDTKKPTLNFLTRKSQHNHGRNTINSHITRKFGDDTKQNFKPFDQSQNQCQTKLNIPNYCAFCKLRNHESNDCKKVPDNRERLHIIRSEKRCWICYSDEHNSFQCHLEKCSVCGNCHNTSLCNKHQYSFNRNNTSVKEEHKFNSGNVKSPLTGSNTVQPIVNQNFRFTPITPNHQ